MKRIKYLLFAFIVGIMGLVNVNAASITVKSNSTNPTVGSSIKVTVSVGNVGQSSGKVGSWEYCVEYDKNKLTLVTPTSACVADTVGHSSSETFTFKVKASGTSTISLADVELYDFETEEKVAANFAPININAKAQEDISSDTKEKTGSDNAYLRALEVVDYKLTPEFNKKTYSYEVEVPNDVTEVGINAFKEDPNAIISTNAKDIDHIQLTEGVNKVVITVRAEKGNKLEYVVNIKRSEEDPIVVNIDGKEYTVLRSLDEVEKPKYYTDSSLEIEEQTVESLSSDVTGYTLVALKDEDGNVVLFSYSEGSYERYVEVNNELTTLIPKETKKLIEGFTQSKEIDINGNKVTVYYNDSNSDFVLLYAMNVGNGETAWYSYDIKEGTLQRYNGEVKVEKKGKDIYFYLAIAFAVISGLAILIVFIVLGLNNRLKKKNDRLVNKLKDKKVKIVEHPVFDLDMKVDSWKDIKNDDDISDTEFFARPDDTMVKINEDVEIKDDAFETEETPIVEEVEEKPTKRREKKKLKEDKEKEEAELKAMRDDFLKTRELEITKEMRKAGESKKAKKKAKKKKK